MKREQLTHSAVAETPATTPLTMGLSAFLLDGEARRLSSRTIEFYSKELQPFLTYLESAGITALQAIAPTHIRAYLVSLQQRGLGDYSQHAAARAMRAFLNFSVNEGFLAESPMRRVKMPTLDKRILPAFPPEDVRKLLDACLTIRNTVLVLCLIDTGCRAREFVGLNVGDVDLRTGAVMVHQGKGRKDRVTFLGTRTRKALVKYLLTRQPTLPAEALWLSHNTGKRLTGDGLRQLLQRIGRRAGVKHCHPHTFRRTCALWSLRAGMNIYALQQLMGHTDLGILRRYLALVEEDLQDAHRKHGAVDNML